MTLPAAASITIDKTGALDIASTAPAGRANPGDLISYNFVVTNTGNVTLHGVVVTDASVVATLSCPLDINPLSPNESQTCTATHALVQGDIDTGHVDNTATVKAEKPSGDYLEPLDDVTAIDSESVPVPQIKDLALDKASADGPYDHVGQTLNYTYTLTNTGNVTLGGPFEITDDRSTDAACSDSTIAPGDSITCNGTYAVTQVDLDVGSVTNTATGTGMFGAEPITSNSDSVTILADQKPAISLVKTAVQRTYNLAGQVLDYTYKVTNTGNVTLEHAGLRVRRQRHRAADLQSDDANDNGLLDVGETWTFTAEHPSRRTTSTTAPSPTRPPVHATFGSTTYDSNTVTVTVTATQNPSLDLTKAVLEATYTHVGQILHYTFVLTNAGNVTLTSPSVTDNKTDSAPVYDTGDDGDGKLEVDEAWTFKAVHYGHASPDINDGSITNVAVVTRCSRPSRSRAIRRPRPSARPPPISRSRRQAPSQRFSSTTPSPTR